MHPALALALARFLSLTHTDAQHTPAMQEVIFRKIIVGNYEFHFEYWADISDSAKDLITKLLTLDPSKVVMVVVVGGA